MERIPEPELMEEKEQVISYDEADFSEGEFNLINQINHYLLRKNISLGEKDLIVDLGCGPGNISEKLAIRWPNTEVVGIDGSKEMILRAEYNKNISSKQKILKNLRYVCADIKDIKSNNFTFKKISLLVSNSLIHHITNLEDFFNTIRILSSNITVNFHKDLKRPLDEKSALELKAKCSKKYNEILTNDYYASLRASYTFNELKNFTLENDLSSLDVFEEGDNYLIVYGNV
ncbi:class I SAM-dependent methyltransferase [Prochlorococcus marinus]|uniref:class I SAM-dependent methyltransferase n=1 Tax=Prochlorococcus marinus TaxID=1219 RepID=UPI001ADCF559|nr:class I SAM-dependent methyltransferase [Prochlorococcus marinus]MBO8216998.1 class I SAM-dependent methyltransferase [Prochlorococcus marinus XMU1405]MBW3040230.1 SAM-dependent methyltransferase [Prochlorococcus marinus str. MU1405]MBW3047688.1 SAM-dependent methyltransferase [Prochlorococcus marinus str. MU1406]